MALPQIKVIKSQIHGQGVVALEPISPNTKITEYAGEIISMLEADKREIKNSKKGLTYIFEYDDKTCIDGEVLGNQSRYINHSCEPNCDVIRKAGKIFFYSNRLINPGEELTVDYAYDKNDKLEPCHCDSTNCRRYINEI